MPISNSKNLVHGHMAQHAQGVTVTIVTQFVSVDIASGFTDGDGTGIVFQNSKELKVLEPGTFLLNWNVSIELATGANVSMLGGISVNGTLDNLTTAHALVSTANDLINVSGVGDLVLAENDLIRLAIVNLSDTTNFVVEHAAITMFKIED